MKPLTDSQLIMKALAYILISTTTKKRLEVEDKMIGELLERAEK